MVSTIMRHSKLPDQWLLEAIRNNPVQPIDDRWLSGPVRLAFPNLFTPKEQKRDNGETVLLYEATLLFPPIVDVSGPWRAAEQMAQAKWPGNVVNNQLMGVGMPFTRQDDKSIKYEGFTPGGWKLSARSKFQPQVIDAATGQAITDPKRVYSGCWAICDFHFYPTSIKGNRINTSLSVVYIFADDESFEGGGPDPSKGLAAVKTMAPILPPPSRLNAAASAPPGMPQQPYGAPQGYAPPQTYHNAPNVPPPPPAPAYAPPPGAPMYQAPMQSYAPMVETEEQRMLREAGLA